MSKKKQNEESLADPPQDIHPESAAVREPGAEAPMDTQPEPAKRKRRNAIEMFADQKREHAEAVTAAECLLKAAEAALDEARAAQEQFLINAREALGL
jgi:hypothetical protein